MTSGESTIFPLSAEEFVGSTTGAPRREQTWSSSTRTSPEPFRPARPSMTPCGCSLMWLPRLPLRSGARDDGPSDPRLQRTRLRAPLSRQSLGDAIN